MLWLAAIPGRVWATVALAAALLCLVWFALHWHSNQVQAVYDSGVAAERVRGDAAVALAKQQGASDTAELQKGRDDDRKSYNEQMAVLGRAAAVAVDGLRDRASRPPASAANVPSVASSGPTGCRTTGAGLYREDGEFLIGEATTASRRAAYIAQCFTAYQRAREKSLTAPSQ